MVEHQIKKPSGWKGKKLILGGRKIPNQDFTTCVLSVEKKPWDSLGRGTKKNAFQYMYGIIKTKQ